MRRVVVYTKEGCHLCERVITELGKLNKTRALMISTEDISAENELFERYKNIVPLVTIDGKVILTAESLAGRREFEGSMRSALLAATFDDSKKP